jgi:hypothetical protein
VDRRPNPGLGQGIVEVEDDADPTRALESRERAATRQVPVVDRDAYEA